VAPQEDRGGGSLWGRVRGVAEDVGVGRRGRPVGLDAAGLEAAGALGAESFVVAEEIAAGDRRSNGPLTSASSPQVAPPSWEWIERVSVR
jgi:hypothetical protein